MSDDLEILKAIINDNQSEFPTIQDKDDLFQRVCCLHLLKDYDVDSEDISNGITDAKDDGQIDAIYFFINQTLNSLDEKIKPSPKNPVFDLHIITSKNTDGISEDPIRKMRNTFADLFAGKIVSNLSSYNSDILQKIKRFRKFYISSAAKTPKLRIWVSYFTKSKTETTNRKADEQLNALIKDVKAIYPNAETSGKIYKARDIIEIARAAQKRTFVFNFDNLFRASQSPNTYIGLLKMVEYNTQITSKDGYPLSRLFEANVRDYEGGSKDVNSKIHSTLVSPNQDDFWWLNNGISIISDSAQADDTTLTVENPLVVNGLQTSYEIARHFREIPSSKWKKEKRRVLVKVVASSDGSTRDAIIRANNNQTHIPAIQLRITDPIHRDIEDFLRSKGIYYERRKNHWKNLGKPKDKRITLGELSQSVMSMSQGAPDDARARPETKFNKSYSDLFNPSIGLNFYEVCAKSYLNVLEVLKKETSLTRKDKNNVKFHSLFALAQLAVNQKMPTVSAVSHAAIDKFSISMAETAVVRVVKIYNQMKKNAAEPDKISKGKGLLNKLIDTFPEKKAVIKRKT